MARILKSEPLILKSKAHIFSLLGGVYKKLCFSFQFSARETDILPVLFWHKYFRPFQQFPSFYTKAMSLPSLPVCSAKQHINLLLIPCLSTFPQANGRDVWLSLSYVPVRPRRGGWHTTVLCCISSRTI